MPTDFVGGYLLTLWTRGVKVPLKEKLTEKLCQVNVLYVPESLVASNDVHHDFSKNKQKWDAELKRFVLRFAPASRTTVFAKDGLFMV